MEYNQSKFSSNILTIKGAKSLIFDIGGIILDDSDQPLFEHLGLSANEATDLASIIHDDDRWRIDAMTGKLKTADYLQTLIQEHPEHARELEVALNPKYFDQVLPLYQPNLDLLKTLHRARKYQMFWLSNMNDTEYEILTKKGILDLLDGGAYSCIDHLRKPDPQFYQTLFDRYQLNPSECIFFDDRQRNLDAGEALGLRGVLIPSLDQLANIIKPLTEEENYAK